MAKKKSRRDGWGLFLLFCFVAYMAWLVRDAL